MAEIIDIVFTKTSPKRSFSMTEYKRFGLVFTKTRVYKFGHSTAHPTADGMTNRVVVPARQWESIPGLLKRFEG